MLPKSTSKLVSMYQTKKYKQSIVTNHTPKHTHASKNAKKMTPILHHVSPKCDLRLWTNPLKSSEVRLSLTRAS